MEVLRVYEPVIVIAMSSLSGADRAHMAAQLNDLAFQISSSIMRLSMRIERGDDSAISEIPDEMMKISVAMDFRDDEEDDEDGEDSENEDENASEPDEDTPKGLGGKSKDSYRLFRQRMLKILNKNMKKPPPRTVDRTRNIYVKSNNPVPNPEVTKTSSKKRNLYKWIAGAGFLYNTLGVSYLQQDSLRDPKTDKTTDAGKPLFWHFGIGPDTHDIKEKWMRDNLAASQKKDGLFQSLMPGKKLMEPNRAVEKDKDEVEVAGFVHPFKISEGVDSNGMEKERNIQVRFLMRTWPKPVVQLYDTFSRKIDKFTSDSRR